MYRCGLGDLLLWGTTAFLLNYTKGRYDLGVEFHRRRLARHMGRLLVTDQPLICGIDPGVQSLVEDQPQGLLLLSRDRACGSR